MRWSRAFFPTLRETPKDAEALSHQLMFRAGMIRQLGSGAYSYLPLGMRVLSRVTTIIRDEMNRAGAQEVLLPALHPLELRRFSTNVIACPSCGRCEIDVVGIAKQVNDRLQTLAKTEPRCLELTVAVMGCVVNGPGESEHADIGLAGGGGVGIIYRNGQQLRRVPEAEMVDTLLAEVQRLLHEKQGVRPPALELST